jgi:hypothetical protein
MTERIEFDLTTALGRHAEAERRFRLSKNSLGPHWLEVRNIMYEDYTKTPHPSTLGRGGSQ